MKRTPNSFATALPRLSAVTIVISVAGTVRCRRRSGGSPCSNLSHSKIKIFFPTFFRVIFFLSFLFCSFFDFFSLLFFSHSYSYTEQMWGKKFLVVGLGNLEKGPPPLL